MKITFANEIANLCDAIGASYGEVRKGMASDSRIGKQFLYAGIGYGGSCFPKDVRALVKTAAALKSPLHLLESVEAVNEKQKLVLYDKIAGHFRGRENLHGKKFAVWGLSFKPGTDDMREAPAIPIITSLTSAGATVSAFDPVAVENARSIFGEGIQYENADHYQVLEGADALVLLTEWPQFRFPDFERLKKLMRKPLIFDGRNQFKVADMQELGFHYYSIGNGHC